jgi:hypothetical protein
MHKKREMDWKSWFYFSKYPRGQVTIFIIIGIVIVAAVAVFLIFRDNLTGGNIPASIEPAYNTFLSCLEDKTKIGIDVLESQGGYIYLPEFESGNDYMPFSSQLDFLGNPIPYWYYVSGNNIQKEQIPSLNELENDLERFVEEKIIECNFDSYYEQGFEINQAEPSANVKINNDNVNILLRMDMEITFGEDNTLIQTHEANIKSNLGTLYNSAKKVYEQEKRELFLENYGIDVLRLYAPVDGVELTCSPKVWNADEIFEDLKIAIETNTLAIHNEKPSTKDEEYFFFEGIDEEVRFVNSQNWKSSFEVLPSDDNILIATPIGNQAGLGILGFCYVSYHFVYNVKYPVLIQISKGEETFQFPFAVVIQGNKPRVPLNSSVSIGVSNLCPNKNTITTIQTYDSNFNSVDSRISYECFGESCSIGQTSGGKLTTEFPQCANGFVVANAEGFQETRYQYSTIQEGGVSIVMKKLYETNVNLEIDNADYNGEAIIYFNSEDDSKVVSYPAQKTVRLSEGDYEISVYVYKKSSIKFPESTTQECVSTIRPGIAGIFGITEKKCFDVKIPAQTVSNVLAGGGVQNYYILENDLKNSNTLKINAEGLATPTTIEQVQNNYILFEEKTLEVNFE